jgi:hypothetical protein
MDAALWPLADRRLAARQLVTDARHVTGRVLPGHEAQILNISPGGALLETGCRLVPGAWIELRLATGRGRTGTRARVVSSSIVRMRSDSLRYQSGVKFERRLEWPAPGQDDGAIEGDGGCAGTT